MTIEDQPPPIHQPEHVPIWDLVIKDYEEYSRTGIRADATDRSVLDDMAARDAVGRERYGTPLTTHNGRNHLVDAYQEALDLAVYLRNEIEEHATTPDIREMYRTTLMHIRRLRKAIDERDSK